MSHVIEAPEITEEIQEQPFHAVEHAEPALHSGLARRIATCIARVAARRRQRSQEMISHHNAPEAAVDMLARKYPYIYIKAMSG